MGNTVWPLIVLFAISVVQSIREGVRQDYLWLGAGAILAAVAMFFYALISVERANGKPKRAWMGFAAIGGFVPYLYSLYVIGYWGLWSLREIGSAPVGSSVMKTGFFTLFGYLFLRSYYRLTELGRKVDTVLGVGDKYQGQETD